MDPADGALKGNNSNEVSRAKEVGKERRRDWNRIARILGLLITILLAAGAIFVVLGDRPQSPARFAYMGVAFDCSGDATLIQHGDPELDLDLLDETEFQGVFAGSFFTQGNGTCKVYLAVPPISAVISDTPPGAEVDRSGDIQMQLAKDTGYAVGVAPPQNSPDDQRILTFSFTSHTSLVKTGWGRTGFYFDVGDLGIGPDLQQLMPLPANPSAIEGTAGLDLSIQCPFGRQLSTPFPSNYFEERPDKASWTVQPLKLPNGYSGACENKSTRFYVDHSTDIFITAIGAVLGCKHSALI